MSALWGTVGAWWGTMEQRDLGMHCGNIINAFKSTVLWLEEMAQQLSGLVALPEDPGSVPSTHTAVHNRL